MSSDGMNILGLVMFSVALGITIGYIGEEGVPLKAFFKSLEAVSMKLISLVIWYSPIGITFLIAAQIVGMKDPGKEVQRLMGYMITVLIGLFIHGFVVLPILMITLARRNPIKYVYGMAQALLTALATSSRNMDGTALYEAVAAIYISQCVGLDLSMGQVILVSLTATLASIGAAGIPQAGIVTMIMVLIAIGLPSNLFILIFPVDFFLDRIRTTVNVHGDSIGAAVVGKLCEKGNTEVDNDARYQKAMSRPPLKILTEEVLMQQAKQHVRCLKILVEDECVETNRTGGIRKLHVAAMGHEKICDKYVLPIRALPNYDFLKHK
ncbi:putative sodium-dependent excitatory amino acid transporter glt-4 [Parelaphostrongylus tenuis]|uniref:Amino acid transporter n=1 Tax=Parelaphostrongylus tenuis TaxID=148309 RepID=A0AAD5N9H0_PARTN|nr:putative sodium-dependent excitatory amino acid transporter glt-4 [Parelaphostrongylus tenuis]